MASVINRIKQIKQPHGGYLPVRNFDVKDFGGEKVTNLEEENITPVIIGLAVEYLTRYYLDRDRVIEEAFAVSLRGAFLVNQLERAYHCCEIIEDEEYLTDRAIINACYLVSYDIAVKAGPWVFNPSILNHPNPKTINNIRLFVERSVYFLNVVDKVEMLKFVLPKDSLTYFCSSGEGDFTTKEGMWDLKVSKNKPTSKDTLEVLIYYLMGLQAEELRRHFLDFKRIGFFNPRLNQVYSYEVKNIPDEVIDDVMSFVIGY